MEHINYRETKNETFILITLNDLLISEKNNILSTGLQVNSRSSRLSLVNDDSSFEYRRRKSSSSSTISYQENPISTPSESVCKYTEPYIYVHDDLERYKDGTVVLRLVNLNVVLCPFLNNSLTKLHFVLRF